MFESGIHGCGTKKLILPVVLATLLLTLSPTDNRGLTHQPSPQVSLPNDNIPQRVKWMDAASAHMSYFAWSTRRLTMPGSRKKVKKTRRSNQQQHRSLHHPTLGWLTGVRLLLTRLLYTSIPHSLPLGNPRRIGPYPESQPRQRAPDTRLKELDSIWKSPQS
jgi:hypothetical protein